MDLTNRRILIQEKLEETAQAVAYIQCSRCNYKYHNSVERIKINVGYNRLGEHDKSCVTCREKKREGGTVNITQKHIENTQFNIRKTMITFITQKKRILCTKGQRVWIATVK